MDLKLLIEHLWDALRRGKIKLVPAVLALFWVVMEVAFGEARWALLPWALWAIAYIGIVVGDLVADPAKPGEGEPELIRLSDQRLLRPSIRVLAGVLSACLLLPVGMLAEQGEGRTVVFAVLGSAFFLLLALTGGGHPWAEAPEAAPRPPAGAADEGETGDVPRALGAGDGPFQEIPIRAPAEPEPVRRPAPG